MKHVIVVTLILVAVSTHSAGAGVAIDTYDAVGQPINHSAVVFDTPYGEIDDTFIQGAGTYDGAGGGLAGEWTWTIVVFLPVALDAGDVVDIADSSGDLAGRDICGSILTNAELADLQMLRERGIQFEYIEQAGEACTVGDTTYYPQRFLFDVTAQAGSHQISLQDVGDLIYEEECKNYKGQVGNYVFKKPRHTTTAEATVTTNIFQGFLESTDLEVDSAGKCGSKKALRGDVLQGTAAGVFAVVIPLAGTMTVKYLTATAVGPAGVTVELHAGYDVTFTGKRTGLPNAGYRIEGGGNFLFNA